MIAPSSGESIGVVQLEQIGCLVKMRYQDHLVVGEVRADTVRFGGITGEVMQGRPDTTANVIFLGDIHLTNKYRLTSQSSKPVPSPKLMWTLMDDDKGSCTSHCLSLAATCVSGRYFETEQDAISKFESLGATSAVSRRRSYPITFYHSTTSISPALGNGWAWWRNDVDCTPNSCCGLKRLCPCAR